MKTNRIIYVACLMAVFACLATSCKKNEESSLVTATMSTLAYDDDAKMYIDFADLVKYQRWNAFDKIMVYNLDFVDGNNSVTSEFTAGAEAEGQITTQFNGPSVGPRKDGYFFFYPSCMAQGDQLDVDNREYFEVSDTQHFTKLKNPNGMTTTTLDPRSFAMACNSQDLTFSMQNIFGAARLYLATSVPDKFVERIEIEDNAFNLVGTCSMKLHNVNAGLLSTTIDYLYNGDDDQFQNMIATYITKTTDDGLGYVSAGTSHIMTLDCSQYTFDGITYNNGVEVSQDGINPTSFVFGMRPAALTYGFVVRVYFMDHTMVTIHDFENLGTVGNRAYCIRPGRIKAIRTQPLNPAVNYDGMHEWGNW